MQHASLEESSAMLLLKMLQPDEGIMALGRILWGLAKASGVNRACALMCGPQWEIYCSMLMLYLHHDDKSHLKPEGSFLCGNFSCNCSTVYMATQHFVSVSLWGCYMQNSVCAHQNTPKKEKKCLTCDAKMLIFIFNNT